MGKSKRKKCEVCRKLVTVGGAMTSHMRGHVAKHEAEELVYCDEKGRQRSRFFFASEPKEIDAKTVRDMLPDRLFASVPGKTKDGALVHLRYRAFRPATERQVGEAKIAKDMGQPLDQYTGRLDRVWKSKAGHTIITMFVILQRKMRYRAFNVDQGQLFDLRVREL